MWYLRFVLRCVCVYVFVLYCVVCMCVLMCVCVLYCVVCM